MWKDFFYFNNGEKRAIIILTFLIIIVQVALWTTAYWLPLLPEKLTNFTANREALKAFQDSLTGKESIGKNDASNYDGNSNTTYSANTKSVKLTVFNPNTADSAKLLSLGLRPYVAKNILKYRRKGGTFRKVEDFARVYGINKVQYDRLKPYIRLASGSPEMNGASFYTDRMTASAKAKNDPALNINENTLDQSLRPEKSNLSSPNFSSPAKSQGSLVMEINKVDTAALQQLKGIGSVTAGRIDRYRSRLGGFYSVSQLEEIKGIYPEALLRLQSLLKVDTTQILKMNANKVSLERLKSHPYLSFYQARVIVELRKARSGIKNIDELAEFKEFTKEDIHRLRWYLSF